MEAYLILCPSHEVCLILILSLLESFHINSVSSHMFMIVRKLALDWFIIRSLIKYM